LRYGYCVMPSGELADLRVLASLAGTAEAHGWDGFFVWDHFLRAPQEPAEIADTTVALTAIALATESIRFGPMVTPLARRRPQKLAKEAVTLDRLSAGRLILGLGLGVDAFGELGQFGDLTDPVRRGDQLDEGAGLLARLMSGQLTDHRGEYFQASDVQLLPAPVQRPRIPIWMAATGERPRPIRRASHYDGLYVLDVDPSAVRRIAATIGERRGSLDGFDLAVSATSDTDLAAMAAAGATWAMYAATPGDPLGAVQDCLAARRSRP
jgi:alkanesulfonate monooxygenase SsuD/methylene tetrahydromethanopterin reductase-like flavin-dependent oxidoreductase (luciferase family)